MGRRNGSPEMREAFLSMANGITHRLLFRSNPALAWSLEISRYPSIAATAQGSPRGVERR